MLSGKTYPPRELARVFLRRKWLFLATFAPVLVAVSLFQLQPATAVSFVLVGLVVSVAINLVLEFRDSSFFSEGEVLRVLGVPVLGSIPMMVGERERTTRRQRRLISLVGWTLLLGSALVFMVWQLRP